MIGTLLLLLTAAGTAVVLLVLFLIVRGVVERRRAFWQRRLHGSGEAEGFGLLAPEPRKGQADTWSGRLDEAFARVVQQTGEFRGGLDKINLGLAVPAALQGIARRLQMQDFDVFVTAVTLHRTVGGNLTLLLDRVATSTRDRNLFRGYFRAATALGRITGIFIAAAAPLLFLGYALWQPDFVSRF